MINPDITAIIAREEQAMIAFVATCTPIRNFPGRRSAPRIASPPDWRPSVSLTAGRIPPESSRHRRRPAGKTVALRADMDALPVVELNDPLDHKSQPGNTPAAMTPIPPCC